MEARKNNELEELSVSKTTVSADMKLLMTRNYHGIIAISTVSSSDRVKLRLTRWNLLKSQQVFDRVSVSPYRVRPKCLFDTLNLTAGGWKNSQPVKE